MNTPGSSDLLVPLAAIAAGFVAALLFRLILLRYARRRESKTAAAFARHTTRPLLLLLPVLCGRGFYDLTQVQLDFFRAVAGRYPTTLFFPLLPVKPGHDAWSFAGRFYERYIQGHTDEPAGDAQLTRLLPANARLFDSDKGRSYARPDEKWHCRIVNTFGIEDEVATAAKEILRLVDDGQLAFHEIGVVARGLEAFGTVIRNCFAQHRIPLAGRLEEPLVVSFGQGGDSTAPSTSQGFPAQPGHRPAVLALFSAPKSRRRTCQRAPRSMGLGDPRAGDLQGRHRMAPAAPLHPARFAAAATLRGR